MKELVFVKLGGSLITVKEIPFMENKKVINELSQEIHHVRKKGKLKLLVGHGGGSFPHVPAAKYQTDIGVINEESYRGISEVQDAASRLNRIVVSALMKAGENAMSIQASSSCIAEDFKIVDFYTKPIKKLLSCGMVPVVYGDVGMDLKRGCCILSTEEIFSFLAKKLKPNKIIFAGLVDGVFDADPQKNMDAKLIKKITPKSYSKIKNLLSGSSGIDVTGGMSHKVEKMIELARIGIKTQIINGLVEGNLEKALLGDEDIGTLILP
jgi:isopentenyl phosphate kinase